MTKLERSWILYDCGNSVYSIIVTTAMFPLFFDAISTGASPTEWLGLANSAGSLAIAILAPILGTLRARRCSFYGTGGTAMKAGVAAWVPGWSGDIQRGISGMYACVDAT